MMQQPCVTGSVGPCASSFSKICRWGTLRGASLPSVGRHTFTKWFANPSSQPRTPISGNKNSLDWAIQRIRGGRTDRPFAGGARRVAVMWFRNDLRVHDNQALAMALRDSTSLLPLYCFDPREYSSTVNGVNTTGPYRAQFIVDAVTDLRDSLRALGSDLIVRIGKPEEILMDLAKKVGASKVYCHSEVTYEEDLTEKRVAAALNTEDIQLKACWGSTLYSPDELPFKLGDMPATHGEFRSAVASLPVQQPEKAPGQLKGKPLGCQDISPGDIPTIAQLGLPPLSRIPGAPKCRGGETEGLAQIGLTLAVHGLPLPKAHVCGGAS
ncbi:hypothetical protein WJX75_007839 [Coccomyxa subellipsoidea]|uniref:Photolyase/cryptochrome alpha/beta domain-containing protein n=1 Tax=Coccomyxa subellipsoidea TaxID=248742 RepID=A0ABR2Z4H0_9CHLO